MKKLIPFAIAAVMAAAQLAGCSSPQSAPPSAAQPPASQAAQPPASQPPASQPPSAQPPASPPQAAPGNAASGYVTGLGIAASLSTSKSAANSAAGSAVSYGTMVAVTLDPSGKITNCSIDEVQPAVAFDATGKITSDLTKEVKSKNEIGAGYGMKKASKIGKEWYEQADAFAQWAIGKTVGEVNGLQVKNVGSEAGVPDSPELTSSVTISVASFKAALTKAAGGAAAGSPSPGPVKTGLGIVTTLNMSKSAAANAPGAAVGDSVVAAVSLDASGKIVQCKLDELQPTINFDSKGQITTDLKKAPQTKDEIRDAYGMAKASGIGKEWYQQADAFSQWAIGKTIAEIDGLQLKTVGSEAGVPDSPELTSSVTISVGNFIKAIDKAAANAR